VQGAAGKIARFVHWAAVKIARFVLTPLLDHDLRALTAAATTLSARKRRSCSAAAR
jgi:hypothetical protein